MKESASGALPKCSVTPHASSGRRPKPSAGSIGRRSVWIIASRSISYVRTPGTRLVHCGTGFRDYENRANPHVTIRKDGCKQLRKRGGVQRHGRGEYKAHATLAEAELYANTTGLPIRFCKFCAPK